MITRIIHSLVVSFLGLVTANVAAQHFPASADLTAFIRSQVEEGRAGGIVVGVIEADGSTRVVSLGSAGLNRRPLGAKSLFEIGSSTKVFTATLLADMVARGEVALSDPVAKYLPSASDATATAVTRGVLISVLKANLSLLIVIPTSLCLSFSTKLRTSTDVCSSLLTRPRIRWLPGLSFEVRHKTLPSLEDLVYIIRIATVR